MFARILVFYIEPCSRTPDAPMIMNVFSLMMPCACPAAPLSLTWKPPGPQLASRRLPTAHRAVTPLRLRSRSGRFETTKCAQAPLAHCLGPALTQFSAGEAAGRPHGARAGGPEAPRRFVRACTRPYYRAQCIIYIPVLRASLRRQISHTPRGRGPAHVPLDETRTL